MSHRILRSILGLAVVAMLLFTGLGVSTAEAQVPEERIGFETAPPVNRWIPVETSARVSPVDSAFLEVTWDLTNLTDDSLDYMMLEFGPRQPLRICHSTGVANGETFTCTTTHRITGIAMSIDARIYVRDDQGQFLTTMANAHWISPFHQHVYNEALPNTIDLARS